MIKGDIKGDSPLFLQVDPFMAKEKSLLTIMEKRYFFKKESRKIN
jgi:hypothetical protein